MKKLIIIILIIYSVLGCKLTYLQKWNKSIEITRPQSVKTFYVPPLKVRTDLIKNNFLNFISENDISYILEDYDFPSETYYGSIWTNSKIFSFSYHKGEIVKKNSILFDSDIYKLVTKWDTTLLLKESEVRFNRANPNHYMTAFKVNKQKNKFIVNRYVFKPF